MHITLISIIASTISKIRSHFSTLFSFTSSFYKSVNNKYKTSYEISCRKDLSFPHLKHHYISLTVLKIYFVFLFNYFTSTNNSPV